MCLCSCVYLRKGGNPWEFPLVSRCTHILLGAQSVGSAIADCWVMACSRNVLSATPLHCVLLLSSCQTECWSSLHGCRICSRYVEVYCLKIVPSCSGGGMNAIMCACQIGTVLCLITFILHTPKVELPTSLYNYRKTC